ncbi:MAG: hypothetical protein ACI9VI_000456 [Candidatus Azotimanducaceae bacterium]|jgi:hypothetical protein
MATETAVVMVVACHSDLFVELQRNIAGAMCD